MKSSNEITLEAWIRIDDPDANGPARIMSVSFDINLRGATLGQNGFNSPATGDYFYTIRMNTTAAAGSGNLNGLPELSTGERYQAGQIQHVVYTRDAGGIERIYVNGVIVETGSRGGNLSSWANNYKLALANEIGEGRSFLGAFFLSAIFSRSLTEAEVLQNFQAGYTNILPKLVAPNAPFLIANTPNSLTIGAITSFSAENDVYELYLDSGLTNLVEIQTVQRGNEAVFTGLTPNTQYWWRAKSTATQARDSNYSIIVSGSTQAPNSVPVASNVQISVEKNIKISDDFAGSVIDNTRWTGASTNVEIAQNEVLTLKDTSGGTGTQLTSNRINESSAIFQGQYYAGQCDLDFTVNSGADQGFLLLSNVGSYAGIINKASVAGNVYSLIIVDAGVTLYEFDTAVTHGKTVRIIRTENDTIRFEYLNAGSWVQMGADQQIPLTGSPSVRFEFASASTSDASEYTMTVDNFYSSITPYSTPAPSDFNVLKGSYTYSDNESDTEGVSTFRWFKDDDGAGTNKALVPGATEQQYVVPASDVGKYFYFEVTPVATTGASPGLEVEGPPVQVGQPGIGFGDVTSATLIAHWDFSDPAHRIEDSTGAQTTVQQFNDLSGNANHLIQNTKSLQYIVNSGFCSNDATKYMKVNFGVDYQQPNTFILVQKWEPTPVPTYCFGGLTSTKRNAGYRVSANVYRMFAGAEISLDSSDDRNILHMGTFIFNSPTCDYFYNNTKRNGISRNAGNQPVDGVTLGAAFSNGLRANHDIYEMAVFDGIVSESEIQQLVQRMVSKHGIIL